MQVILRSIHFFFSISLVVLSVLLATPVRSQTPEPGASLPEENAEDTNLDGTDDRDPVWVGLRLIEVSDIDSREETFTIEAILYVQWLHDFGTEDRSWGGEGVDIQLKQLKDHPVPEFENGLGLRKRSGLLMHYDWEHKKFEYEERFSMTFSADLELQRFPFDSQNLNIQVLISGASEEDTKLQILEYATSSVDEAEWFTDPKASFVSEVEHNIKPYDIEDSNPSPRARFDIIIQRRWGFYFWRVLLPLLIITTVSWAAFWMKREDLGDRLSVTFTALLTVVAFSLILGDLLPRIAYLTYLDVLITLTYVWLGVSVVQSVIAHNLETSERSHLARRLDKVSRYLLPSTYYAACAVVSFVFLT